jgi:hypothetical protein
MGYCKTIRKKSQPSLWVAWYNFVRVDTAIRMTPCMAAGLPITFGRWRSFSVVRWTPETEHGTIAQFATAHAQRGIMQPTKFYDLCCPNCSKADIRRHFGWRAFAVSIGVYLLVSVVLYSSRRFTEQVFILSLLDGFVSTCVVVSVVWIFFSALVGKNRCRECGHRWRA